MTYATFISQLRVQAGDTNRKIHVDFTGDASTTIFQMPVDTYPILESSYTIKIAGVTKTETTDYALDKETGTITFVSAPANAAAIDIDCTAVYLIDDTWLNIINDVIRSLGDDFFKEFTDITNFTTTAYMTSLDLSTRSNCIAVADVWYRDTSTSDWVIVKGFANLRYDRENNYIYIGSRGAFTESDKELKIRGLETYTLGDETTDDIDVQDRFLTILEYGSIARYWRYRYKSVVELVSKMTLEQSRTPLQELMMLSDRYVRDFENEKAKLKPQKPIKVLSPFIEGGGTP